MFETLRKMIAGADVEYADLRHETKTEVSVVFGGHDLKEVSSNRSDGYVLRVLDRGGLATVAFTKPEDADRAVRTATENARLLGAGRKEPVRLAGTEPVRDDFRPTLDEDPREVPLEEKIEVTRALNELALGHEKIVTTDLAYRDLIREKHFVSTEGAEVREDLVTTRFSGTIVSRDGDLIQNVRVASGGSGGFHHIRDQEKNFEERTKYALDLLRADPAEGGTYDCILNPGLSGVFAHEAFGHYSEADIVETMPALREKMRIGAELGSEVVTITDDATRADQVGFYRYDDEGVAVRPTSLMRDGVLTGRLHSRQTAAAFDEPLSGHHIAEDYRYHPIVRMGCIYIEPGESTFEDLLARLGDGLYVLDAKGGQTSGESFSFGAQRAYEVKNGKVGRMIRDLNVSGDLFRTLKSIEAVGDDFELSKAGGCGKGQLNIRSCNGGPHILVRGLVVGGA
jgi:TldD protein